MTDVVDRSTLGEPGHSSAALSSAVEDFLFYEAELLDSWQLDKWLGLLTEDCSYLVPSTDQPDGHPDHHLFLIQDDRFLLEHRVSSLLSNSARAETPHSTTRRLVTNVRAILRGEGTVDVQANFVIYRARLGTVDVYPGRYEMVLKVDDTGFKIHERKAILSLEELRPHGRVSFIL